jgi:hypothetical protein
MLHRLLRGSFPATAAGGSAPSIARLPAESAVAALAQVARILTDHQSELHRARTEPSHADWSEQVLDSAATAVAGALAAAESAASAEGPGGSDIAKDRLSLETAIRELYRTQGETLRALESAFDETSGYAAWDAPSNPVRDLVAAYLSEGAEARSRA